MDNDDDDNDDGGDGDGGGGSGGGGGGLTAFVSNLVVPHTLHVFLLTENFCGSRRGDFVLGINRSKR